MSISDLMLQQTWRIFFVCVGNGVFHSEDSCFVFRS